jgi:hypothetical protein
MSSLANQQQNLSFPGLLQVPGGITSTLQQVQDGNGNVTGLSLSSAGASVTTSSTFQASKNGTTLTGALPRLISDGFGDLPTVKDFGAVGNGVTDDTAAFTAAIAASPTGVAVPAGSYKIIGTVTGNFYSFGTVTIVTGTVTSLQNITAYKASATGAVARTLYNKLSDIISVKDFGAVGNGVTDDTAAIQATINAAASLSNGGTVFLPSGTYVVSATLVIPVTVNCIALAGDNSKSNSRLLRAVSFVAGDLIYANSNTGGANAALVIKDLMIYQGASYQTSGYAIHLNARGLVLIDNVNIIDGFGGVLISSTAITVSENITLNDVTYIQTSNYALTYGSSDAGINIKGHPVAILISNCGCSCQNITTANALKYGLFIDGADGIQISNCFFNGITGIGIAPSPNSTPLDDIFFSNCIIDTCRTYGVHLDGVVSAGYSYTNIRFVGCHINTSIASGLASSNVLITGTCDYVIFDSCNFNLSGWHSVYISQPAASYTGQPIASIIFSDCDNSGNGLNTANSANYFIDTNNTGIAIKGGYAGNRPGSFGSTTYGVALQGSNSNISISNVNLLNNTIGTIYTNSLSTSNIVISDNTGIDNTILTVASATTISIKVAKIVNLTGTTNVQTISDGWIGRIIYFYTSTGSITFTTGGNIWGNKTIPMNEAIAFLFDGSTWHPLR